MVRHNGTSMKRKPLKSAPRRCDFFLLRYVPDAVKNEFVNFGVVLMERPDTTLGPTHAFAGVKFTRDWRRLQGLAPDADQEIIEALEIELRLILQTPVDRDATLKRIHDSFSGTVQVSPVQGCLTDSPQEEMNRLAELYLESRRPRQETTARGRQQIFMRMRDAFETAGVWDQMLHPIAVSPYTQAGDPLRIDCGYKFNGTTKLFQAMSVETDPDSAKILAFSYPKLVAGIARMERGRTELRAILSDDDATSASAAFAVGTLEQSGIVVSRLSDLGGIAQGVRNELSI